MVRRARAQMQLPFRVHGGARKGAGRKPKGDVAGMSHGTRETFPARYPVHVSMKVVKGLPSLRSRRLFRVVRDAIAGGSDRLGVRICQFSVQTNHLHLVVEANGKGDLARGMQGLSIRIAKAIQRALCRAGSIFADRYFSRILRTPLEVKRALAYVLENARKHGSILNGIDPCSSGAWFDRWNRRGHDSADMRDGSWIPQARTWLLRSGWRLHGGIEIGGIRGRG